MPYMTKPSTLNPKALRSLLRRVECHLLAQPLDEANLNALRSSASFATALTTLAREQSLSRSPIGPLGVKLAHLSIFELYAFQKLCLNAEKRGTPFSRVFFGSLKVPRGEEAKAGTGSRHPEAH